MFSDKRNTQINKEQKSQKIIFGSYLFRGTMQPARLICQYIGVQYQNKFFNPITWNQYKKQNCQTWLYQQVPFVKHGQLVLTNGLAAVQYILQLYNRTDLLAQNQDQKLSIYLCPSFYNVVMGAIAQECDMRDFSLQEDKNKRREKYWNDILQPKFKKVQEKCKGPFYFNHLSMIDFFLYQDYLLLKFLYPAKIWQNVAKIPIIKKFQEERAIKEKCPKNYFIKFAQQYKKKKLQNPSSSNVISGQQAQNICQSEKNSSFFKLCNQDKGNNKVGFCKYKPQNQMDNQ